MAQNLPQALPGNLQLLDWGLRSLLLIRMQNAHVFRSNHGVEESVAAARRANLRFPKLAFDMPELTALRREAIILDIMEDSENDGSILNQETTWKPFKITATGIGGGKGDLHGFSITIWI